MIEKSLDLENVAQLNIIWWGHIQDLSFNQIVHSETIDLHSIIYSTTHENFNPAVIVFLKLFTSFAYSTTIL